MLDQSPGSRVSKHYEKPWLSVTARTTALSHSRRVQGLKLRRFTPGPSVLRSPLHSNLGIFLSLA